MTPSARLACAAAPALAPLAAAASEDAWDPVCDMPPVMSNDAAELSAALACMQLRIDDLRAESAAMRARAEAAEAMARMALRIARDMADQVARAE
ncbi:hypothetical protein ACQ5SO_05980 [Rhodovulum sp. DZ06]|uniref:hypothetical protein n=1 Tax=Rhodovulum sp. DZ06 TaxID=3425126 RepID=UPI003D331F6B